MLKKQILISCLILALSCGLAHAAQVVEYLNPTGYTIAGNDVSADFDVTAALGANSYVVLGMVAEGETADAANLSATFDTTALTQVGGAFDTPQGGNEGFCALFYAPISSLDAGTYTATVTNSYNGKTVEFVLWTVTGATGIADAAWISYRDDENGNPPGLGGLNVPAATPQFIPAPANSETGVGDSDFSSAAVGDFVICIYDTGASPDWVEFTQTNSGLNLHYQGKNQLGSTNLEYGTYSGFLAGTNEVSFDITVPGFGWYRWATTAIAFYDSFSNPDPANGEQFQGVLVDQLNWTNPPQPMIQDPEDPNGMIGDPNFTDITYTLYLDTVNPPVTAVATAIDVSTDWSLNVSEAVTAGFNETYYWQVVINGTGPGGVSGVIEGPIWSFISISNLPPEVDAGDDVFTWIEPISDTDPNWATKVVTLTATADDPDDGPQPLSYLWEMTGGSATRIELPVDMTTPSIDVTILEPYYAHWTFKCTVTDGLDSASDEVEIYAKWTACQAAKEQPGFVQPLGDLSNDCKVDFDDFIILANDWMACVSVECP